MGLNGAEQDQLQSPEQQQKKTEPTKAKKVPDVGWTPLHRPVETTRTRQMCRDWHNRFKSPNRVLAAKSAAGCVGPEWPMSGPHLPRYRATGPLDPFPAPHPLNLPFLL